jgi:putative hemolysin
MYTILILLLFLLLSISAILSGSETALFSLSSLKVSILKNDPSWRKRCVASLLEKPKDLLVTILMVNIAMNILVQNVISNVFDKNSGPLLTVGLPLVLTLFLGEAIPKSIAITRNLQISVMTAPILYAIRIFISPIRKILTKLAQKISRFVFFFLRKEPEISYDELKHALITSQKSGIISREEAKLIHGALKIDESLVKAIMTARGEILLYNIEDPIDKLLHTFVDEECSQVPVINKNLDQVLGIITSASFFLNKTRIKTGEDIKLYLKRPLFVPETITARKLLMNFHAANETIALAVDEYGQVSGLVTKEDVVELVVGQIEDKRDEEVLYTKQGDDAIICSGKLEIAILEEIFDTTFEHAQNAVTIGGWLTEKEGDIPKSGLKIKTNEFLFQVLSSSKSKVDKIYVRRLKS